MSSAQLLKQVLHLAQKQLLCPLTVAQLLQLQAQLKIEQALMPMVVQ